MKKWRGMAAGAMALVMAAAAFTGCAKQETELTKVQLSEVVHSIFYAPQYVALEKGFFQEEGLDVEVSVGQGADKSMTALISGAADIALLGTEAGIYVYNEGSENHAIAFAQLTQRAGNFLVSRQEEPDFQWEDLKGKEVIGGRAGGMPQLVLEYILKSKGIDPETDLELVNNIAFESTAGAFVGDVGDYTVEFEPTATTLENQGNGYIVASLGEDGGYIPYTVYMTTQTFMDEKPEIVQKFTNAIYKGQLWVNSHTSAEIAEVVLPQFPDSDVETLTQIIERYKAQDTWKEDPVFEEKSLDLIQDVMDLGGELSARVPYDELVNTEFAKKAIEQVK